METGRASWWSVVINNPEQTDRQTLEKDNWPSFVKAVKYQEEIGQNGTPHLQIAVNTTQIRFSALKDWLKRAHIKPATTKAHIDNLKQYVHKSETSVEGTQVDETKEYLTQKQALMYIASVYEPVEDNMEPKLYKEALEDAFWKAVRTLLYKNADWVQVLTNPQVQRAWNHTKQVWLDYHAQDSMTNIVIKTDSQTVGLPVSIDSPGYDIADSSA